MDWKRTAICLTIAGMTVIGGSGMTNAAYPAHFSYDIGDTVNAKNFRNTDERPVLVSFTGKPTVLLTIPYGYNKKKLQYLTQLEKEYGSQMNFYFLTRNADKYFQDNAQPFLGNIKVIVCNPMPYSNKESITLVDKDGILRYRLPITWDDKRIQEKFQEVLTEPRPSNVKERQKIMEKEITEQNRVESAFRVDHSMIPEYIGILNTPNSLDGFHIVNALGKDDGHHDAGTLKLAQQAYLLFSMGDKEQALSLINEAIVRDPDDSLVYSLRGYIHSCMGQWEEASKDLTKAMDIKSDYDYFLQDTAVSSHLGLYSRVADDYMGMAEASKNKNKPFFLCATLYIKGQQADKGLALFQKHLEQDKRANQYVDYGVLNMYAGRYEGALQNYNIAQGQFETYVGTDAARRNRLNNFEGTLYRLKAIAEYNLKQYDAARTDIDKAIDIKPTFNLNYGVRAMINDAAGHKGTVDTDVAKAFPKVKKAPPKQ